MPFSKGRLWLCYELFQIIFLEKNVFAQHYCYKYLFSYKWAIHKTPFQIRLLPYVMVKEVPYIVEKEQKLGFCPRTDGNICPGGNTAARTCRSKRTLTRVKWNCNGYRICYLHASNQLFGNPCVNVSKYLEVKYRCVKKSDGDLKGLSLFYSIFEMKN